MKELEMPLMPARSIRSTALPWIVASIGLFVSPCFASEEVPELRPRLTLDCGAYPVCAVAFSSDDSTLAAAIGDGTIQIWDLTKGERIRSLHVDGKPCSIAFSPDGFFIAVGMLRDRPDTQEASISSHLQRQSGVVVLDATTGQMEGASWDHGAHGASFSPDSKRLYVLDNDLLMHFMRNRTKDESKSMPGVSYWELSNGHRETLSNEHIQWVSKMAVAPLGNRIAFGQGDRICIQDMKNKKSVMIELPDQQHFSALSFSPDGSLIFIGSMTPEIQVCESTTGKERAIFRVTQPRRRDAVTAFCVLPNDTDFVSLHEAGNLRRWSLAEKDPVGNYKLEAGWLLGSAFSHDRKSFVGYWTANWSGVREDLPPSWKIGVWDLPVHEETRLR